MLYLGDCLEEMKKIESGSVDMVMCDLPYGTTACKWDAIIPFDLIWKEYRRLTKENSAIVLTASQPFTSALVMSNVKDFRHEWIWKKNCGSNFATLKNNPFKEHESVLVFSKKPVRYFPIFQERSEGGKSMVASCKYESRGGGDAIGGKMKHDKANRGEMRHPSSVQNFNREVGHHPTQKPVKLLEYMVRTYTNEGDTVLDNTMGSGSTGVACANTGRKFIGIEKDPTYFAIAERRIAEAQSLAQAAE